MIGGGFTGGFPRTPDKMKRLPKTGVVQGPPPVKVDPVTLGRNAVRPRPVAMPLGAPKLKPSSSGLPVPPPVVTIAPRRPTPSQAPFQVVILSANPVNLSSCLDAILANEPDTPAGGVIVVDDGARKGCETEFGGVEWLRGIKPFVFARNANLGLQWAGGDVILLNDDALLTTRDGFKRLSQAARARQDLGVLSAGVQGEVGNPNQVFHGGPALVRDEPIKLSFICVYIKAETIARIGLLDERFIDYGWEDNDFCLRCLKAGLRLGVFDGCVVDHSRHEASSYRTKADIGQLITNNRLRFEDKWRGHI